MKAKKLFESFDIFMSPAYFVGRDILFDAKTLLRYFLYVGGKIKVVKNDTEECRIKFCYKGEEWEASYTLDEAREKGLLSHANWQKLPKKILYWRCVVRGLRHFYRGFGGSKL